MPYSPPEYADFMNSAKPSIMNSGGFERKPPETMLMNYGWMSQGPDNEDAVIINRPFDSSVSPAITSQNKRVVRGSICSLTPLGTMVPGVPDEDERPVVAILIGSDADDFDVMGGPQTLDPAEYENAAVAMKMDAHLPFWLLSAGYIFETSAYLPEDEPALRPTTPLTSLYSLTDLDNGGRLRPGHVYVDHIIGVVIEPPAPCGINTSIQSLRFQGDTIPRIKKGVIAQLRD
jgi:hypothetical protein